MTLRLRKGEAADATAAGEICYRAFEAIAVAHGFAPDFPSPEVAAGLLHEFLRNERFFAVIAEVEGRVVGSNFLDERNPIGGIGPITVDPALQNEGAGRALMEAVLQRARERAFPGIRLVQAGYHGRSLALYLKLGFQVREPLACLQGPSLGRAEAGVAVRPATRDDLPACNQVCLRVHGHERDGELAEAVSRGIATVAERAGRLTGYATSIAFFGHAVGESNDDIQALISASRMFQGPGFLVPSRNTELVRWCLGNGLRIVQTMTLMTLGLYNEPAGAWLPSVTF